MQKLHILFFLILTSISCQESMVLETDACDEITCLNGGTCEDGTCDCPIDFSGVDCSIFNKRIKSVQFGPNLFYSILYNNDALVSSVSIYSVNNGLVDSTVFEYINDTIKTYDALNPSPDNYINTIKLSKDSIKQERFSNWASNEYYVIHSGFDPICGYEKRVRFDTQSNAQTTSYEIEYTGENCSFIERRYENSSINNEPFETIEREGDGHPYAYSTAQNPHLQVVQKGNTIRLVVMDEFLQIQEQFSYEATFVYDSDGYPINESRNFFDGTSMDLVYTYH